MRNIDWQSRKYTVANCKYLFNYYTKRRKPGPSLLKLLINFQVYIPLCMGSQILGVWYYCLSSTCSRQSCLLLLFPLPILPILPSGSSPQPCNLLYSREDHSPEPLLQNFLEQRTHVLHYCSIICQRRRKSVFLPGCTWTSCGNDPRHLALGT